MCAECVSKVDNLVDEIVEAHSEIICHKRSGKGDVRKIAFG